MIKEGEEEDEKLGRLVVMGEEEEGLVSACREKKRKG